MGKKIKTVIIEDKGKEEPFIEVQKSYEETGN